jgi:hypothetical protein
MVESRHRMKQARSTAALPVAATLLGLRLFFKGKLPIDSSLIAVLSEMTRVVSIRRRLVPRIRPAKIRPDGMVRQP